MKPEPLDEQRLAPGNFLGEIEDDHLVYFCLNVGDADAQVIVLPKAVDGVRRVIVVDAGVTNKVTALLQSLADAEIISFANPNASTIALVVATHPHGDHIAGIPQLFQKYGEHIAEFWEPGFFHTSALYQAMLREVAARANVVYTQPTSGMRRFFAPVAITVLSPSIHLRNRFDTYGVEINDSSISLRIEHPARALFDMATLGGQGNFAANRASATLILGADAQTLSWSFVATDFPFLAASDTAQAKAINAATGSKDLLSADVLKVSHHASKHGVNLELIERIHPAITLVSSTASGTKYGFPHTVSQEAIREALDPVAGKLNPATGLPNDHKPDAELRLFYTSDTTKAAGGPDAGSVAVLLRGSEQLQLWRFGDRPTGGVGLTNARRWTL
jgi:beta-lactamase superfamily II metal-dependent hydrolase